MKKNSSFIFLSILLLTCFAFVGDENDNKNNGNQRALYMYSNASPCDAGTMNFESGKVDFYFYPESIIPKSDTLKYRWMTYYPGDYFNAYLINTSDSMFLARSQDGSLMMIQEALDEDGKWKPIEFWTHSGCGNSYFNPLKLQPQQYVTIPIRKYSGDFKTKFRLKWKLDTGIRYSSTFEGSMNKTQFNREDDSVDGILYHGPARYFEN